jgi:hypothetical protein
MFKLITSGCEKLAFTLERMGINENSYMNFYFEKEDEICYTEKPCYR